MASASPRTEGRGAQARAAVRGLAARLRAKTVTRGVEARAPRARHRVRLGLAVGPDRVVAVEVRATLRGLRPGRLESRALAPLAGRREWLELAQALREILGAWGADGGTASVAVLRPLAHAKRIAAPRVRRQELRRLVTRGVRRYFLIETDGVVADAARLGRRASRGLAAAIAACAPDDVVEAIEGAVTSAGLRPRLITSASLALAQAVATLPAASRRGRLLLAVRSADWCEGIALDGGAPVLLEPWPAAVRADGDARLLRLAEQAFGDAGEARALVWAGAEPSLRPVTEAGAGRPLSARSPLRLEPVSAAAFGAAIAREDVPALHREPLRRDMRRRIMRRIAGLVAVAAAALAVGAGLYLWGLERELAAVQAARRAMSAEVAQALHVRRAADAIRGRLDAVASVEATQMRWTPVLAALAQTLPDSAYLVSLVADEGNLTLSGLGTSVPSIVPALEAVPFFTDVTLTQASSGGDPGQRQRFDLTLTLSRVPAARAAPAAEAEGSP